ncbi:MAG: Crp/Fnr family transcriptional regulator [Anaerolineae bacterium]|nr:Crp/Fnr family transcriptional regulator [Anaerolineae bacterium]
MSEITAETLAAIPLFAGLDESALAPLVAAARQVTLGAGEILCKQGAPGSTMFMVLDGRLKVFIQGPDEQEIVLDIAGPDNVIGELSLIDGQPRSATIEALSDCTLLALDRDPFMQHLAQNALTALHLLHYLTTIMRQRVLENEVVLTSSSATRLAQTLLFLAERDGRVAQGLITNRLNQKDLAAAIGTSEEWVAQMLAEWCREGIIGMTGARRLLLHDVDALRALSQHDD